jgi:exopolysaccharide biosynthesis WecB/TagA/CpsF family protein
MKSFKVYSFNDFIYQFINTPNGGVFSFLNPYSCLNANYNGQDIIYGVDSYYLANFFLKMKNISFDNSSFAPFFFEFCKKNKKKILFIGALLHENQSFIRQLKVNFIDLEVAGLDGYMESIKYINHILNNNYDFVVIGMGTPLQEKLAITLSIYYPDIKFITCGGYIRQASNGLEYFPPIFTKFRLRFLYRFYKEPHVLKRTFTTYFQFYIKYFYGKFKFVRVR